MSLIHDALKKAHEESKAAAGSGVAAFQGPDAGKPPIQVRTIVLIAVLAVVIGFFVYSKFSGKKAPAPALPAVPALAAIDAQGNNVTLLKKSAVDAYNSDDLDSAWMKLAAALGLEPGDPEIINNMGLVARKRGDVVKARDLYQKALQLKPDYAEALNNLAVLDMQAGNISQALDLLGKALKLEPAYPEANFHMALLLEEKGDKTKAVEYYKRFLEVGKSLPASVIDSVRDHVMEIEP